MSDPPRPPKETSLAVIAPVPAELVPATHPPEAFDGDDILRAWMQNKKPSTLRAYQADLEDFRKFLKVGTKKEAVEIFLANKGRAHSLCLSYIEHLKGRGLQTATIARKINGGLTALVNVARMIDQENKINWSLEVPLPKVEKFKDTQGPGEEVVAQIDDYFARMLAQPRDLKSTMALSRDYTIFRFLSTQAMRRGEIASLDISHVNVFKREINIMGKGKYSRKPIPVPLQTMGILQKWMSLREKDTKLMESKALFVVLNNVHYGKRLSGDAIYDIVKTLERKLGINVSLHPHGFRHGSITTAAKKAKSFADVVSFARHSKADTTLKYIDNMAERAAATAQTVENAIAEDVAAWRAKQEGESSPKKK